MIKHKSLNFTLLMLSPFLILAYLLSLAASPVKDFTLFDDPITLTDIQPLADPAIDTLTAMTYNIGYASGDKNNKGAILTKEEVLQNLDTLASTIKAQNPDVVGLQEVDFLANRTFGIDELEYIARKASLPYAALAITWNKRYVPWPYWPPALQFGEVVSGQALLSRYPIVSQELLKFEKPKENAFWYNWFYLNRIAQKTIIDFPQGPFTVWNLHLEAFQMTTRNLQAKILSHKILQDGLTRTLILGDLNSVSKVKENLTQEQKLDIEDKGEALNIILDETQMRNAETTETGFTMPSWDPIKKIDHILYSPDFKMEQATTIPNVMASDHLAVKAELINN